MPIAPNFIAYHQSLADEFRANKDQIRNLIGNAHWPSDGGHKEAILRRVLQNKLPDNYRVGTGFFSDTNRSSSQIDILITDANKPTLFRNGDFLVVTPDCVKAIVEVKTTLNQPLRIEQAISKLANNVEKVRRYNPSCWAGLFIYEGPDYDTPNFVEGSETQSNNMLEVVNRATNQSAERAINCINIGENNFIRYWPNGTEHINGRLLNAGWHSYLFGSNVHRGLSPAYFIGNLVMHLTTSADSDASRAWFPIQDGMGKEDYRLGYIEFGQDHVNNYR
jgi:hypothetical protein